MKCSSCGNEVSENGICNDCNKSIDHWAKSVSGELLKTWPKTENGSYETPVFLVNRPNLSMEDEMVVGMLKAYGIPAFRKYPNDGSFGRLITGFSGGGTDIYVPESMREDALTLIEGENDNELQG